MLTYVKKTLKTGDVVIVCSCGESFIKSKYNPKYRCDNCTKLNKRLYSKKQKTIEELENIIYKMCRQGDLNG